MLAEDLAERLAQRIGAVLGIVLFIVITLYQKRKRERLEIARTFREGPPGPHVPLAQPIPLGQELGIIFLPFIAGGVAAGIFRDSVGIAMAAIAGGVLLMIVLLTSFCVRRDISPCPSCSKKVMYYRRDRGKRLICPACGDQWLAGE